MNLARGDVVRSSDPFKVGADRQRPWLVVSADDHPFADEQCIALSVSTKQYGPSIPLTDDVWVVGGVPGESFVAPWSVHSPRTEDVVAWQGRVAESLVDRAVDDLRGFVT